MLQDCPCADADRRLLRFAIFSEWAIKALAVELDHLQSAAFTEHPASGKDEVEGAAPLLDVHVGPSHDAIQPQKPILDDVDALQPATDEHARPMPVAGEQPSKGLLPALGSLVVVCGSSDSKQDDGLAPGVVVGMVGTVVSTQGEACNVEFSNLEGLEQILSTRLQPALRAPRKRACDVCGERGASRCGRCGMALYCGPACQRADWASHRRICSVYRAEHGIYSLMLDGHNEKGDGDAGNDGSDGDAGSDGDEGNDANEGGD
jgi:hypothetical protein